MSNNTTNTNTKVNTYQEVIVNGYLSDNPELKYLPDGKAVLNFRIGDKRVFGQGDQRREEWVNYNVVVWEGKGEFNMPEFLNKKLTKGMGVKVSGTLTIRGYFKNDGSVGVSLDINASGFGGVTLSPFVLDGDNGSRTSSGNHNSFNDFAPPSDMDDIPF